MGQVNHNYLAIAEARFHGIPQLPQLVQAVQSAFHQANYNQATVLKNQGMQLEQIGTQQMLLPAVHNHFACLEFDTQGDDCPHVSGANVNALHLRGVD